MALLNGSARQTQAQIIADLTAKVDALSKQIAGQPKTTKRAKAKMPAFRTKAQRLAGDGFACTAGCARRDLRTAGGASSHTPDANGKNWHVAKS